MVQRRAFKKTCKPLIGPLKNMNEGTEKEDYRHKKFEDDDAIKTRRECV